MGQAEMANMYIFIYIYMLIHGKFSPKTLHFFNTKIRKTILVLLPI